MFLFILLQNTIYRMTVSGKSLAVFVVIGVQYVPEFL